MRATFPEILMSRTKCVAVGVTSILVQFALAIVGWGGFAAFFRHPALQALAVATVAISVIAFFAGGNISSGEKEDRANRWVLKAFGVIAILLTFFSAFTDRKNFLTIDGDCTRWIGIAVYVVGALLRLLPVYVLKDRFSGLVAIQPGHTLETRGMYNLIRNPSYLGMLVNSVGWALIFRSGVGVLLALCLLIPLVARMHAEERLLREHFGAEYEAYFARTWRLVPWVY
jgi:protein-S-isoprenylcysteine O-methyltransferase Ste14